MLNRYRNALETGDDWLSADEELVFRRWRPTIGPSTHMDFSYENFDGTCEVTGLHEPCCIVSFWVGDIESVL